MASKEKKKSEKKVAKKIDENSNNKSFVKSTLDPNDENNIKLIDNVTVEEVYIPKEPTPEPNYEEPILAKLVVSSFEGEKMKGLYEGEGETQFVNGNCYKGMFSEGYMHGRGFYIWSDGITYEGDFLKNQITGKGKYIWADGSTYVGDVLNGKRHGFGTFLNAENTKSYTGDWYLGLRHGKGHMKYDAEAQSYYEGDWAHGIKHGWGTRQYPSGNIYNGMWFNNVRHGEGTMRWLDRDQVYVGQWENGIQHGIGQHIWLLRRVYKSQYPLRNMYSGELVNGKRHGEGVFYYANGAKYEGLWKDNMKHGKGKFMFKNGRIYEGMFENDHIVEYPDFTIDGTMSPDLSAIRTRTPIPAENLSFHSNESKNTVSPSFQLDISTLLTNLPSDDSDYESCQVMYAVTRYTSALHRIYTYYSTLGYQESLDNTFIMSKMQFWLFLKDIQVHHSKYTLTDMDRVIGANYQKSNFELHNPYEKILQRQFVNYLIILAHLIYSKDYHEKKETGPLLAYCFSRLMQEKVLCHACKVKSPIYAETKRAINALVHMDQAYEIYQAVCIPRKSPPKEPVLKMRAFLFLLKDLNLINEDLTAKAVIQVLASENPAVFDGDKFYNLELEMTFLEFFEALVGCAEKFVTEQVARDPTTPHISVPLHHQPSVTCPSLIQVASQGVVEEAEGSRRNTITPTPGNQIVGVTSSSNLSHKSEVYVVKASEMTINASSKHASQSKFSPTALQSRDSDTSPVETNASIANNNQIHKTPRGSQMLPLSTVSLPISEVEIMENEDSEIVEEPSVTESEIFKQEEEAEVPLVDEETRKFNFWTHQLHIFCVRKLFPYAEKYIQIKKLIEIRMLENAKMELKVAKESRLIILPSVAELEGESKVFIAEEAEDKAEVIEQ